MSRILAVSACLGFMCTACGGDGGNAESAPDTRVASTVQDIMRYMVDPSSIAVWNSVVIEMTADGEHREAPETPKAWSALRGHALSLVESANLLRMEGRRAAPEGTRSDAPGVNLEPDQIDSLLTSSPEAWASLAQGLADAGSAVLSAVERRDVDGLMTAGDGLNVACENCHIRYWYPEPSNPSGSR